MRRKNRELSHYGLTLTEYDVLTSVSVLDGMYDRLRLLRHTLFLDSACEAPHRSRVMAETALDTCLVKGWIKALTEEDCERDKTRWEEEADQAVSEHKYQTGCIDFTAEGAQLWNRMQNDEAEARGKRVEWGLRYAWRFAGQVRVFSAYEDELWDGTEAIRTGKDVLYSGTFHIERMDGPFALGAWWINRFVRLPNGYRMDIYCTLDAKEE